MFERSNRVYGLGLSLIHISLAAGDYELYEVAAPYGYVLSDRPVPFTIDGSEAVVTVTQYNMPQKGQRCV